MLEYPAGVVSDGFDAGSVSRVGGLDAAIVGADSLIHIASKVIEQVAQEQASIGGEHGVTDGIDVQLARRAQASG